MTTLSVPLSSATNSYATDGQCHNAEPGTFNRECGKAAKWLGRKPNGFVSGFCDDCKQHGHEARPVVEWEEIVS